MSADATPTGIPASAIRHDVVTTFVCFALSGVVAGTWFSRIPAVRDHLHADLRTMGVVLLCFGLGSFCSMPFGGRLNRRWGARTVCTVASVVTCVVLPAATLISSTVAFGAVLVVAGAAFGMWEVTLNVHGAAVERAAGSTIMSALHGFWSGGLILGSSLGAMLASRGVGLTAHFLVTFPVILGCNVVALGLWRDYHRRGPAASASTAGAASMSPAPAARRRVASAITVPIVLLAAMTLCSNVGEGSAADWMALYAHDDRGLSAGRAAAVYATYTVALTVGRLLGSIVIGRFGRVRTLRIAGVVAAAGVASLLVLPGNAGPFVGAAIWGLGLSVVFPAAISAAGDHGGDNAAGAISAVSTMAYGAFLVGPPLIGLLAQSFSIGTALRVVCALALGISVLAFAAAPPARVATGVATNSTAVKRVIGPLSPPPSAFTEDVVFTDAGGGAKLRCTYERHGSMFAGGLRFHGVSAYRSRAESLCTAWHIEGAYDTLVEVEQSDWVSELWAAKPSESWGQWKIRHFLIFLDSAGAYEVAAEDVEWLPEVAVS